MEEEEDHPSQPIQIEVEEHSRRNRILANLRDSILSQLAESNPSLSSNASSIIMHRLQCLFTSFNTPTHPPYALMIRRAITELDEENGSSAKAISYFIQKEYEGLPWAHERILGTQLAKLCQDKELVCNEAGRYVLIADGDGNKAEECKGSRKNRKRGKKRNDHNVDGGGERKGKVAKKDEVVERGNELQDDGNEELVLLHDSDSNRSDERNLVCTQEKGEEALRQSIEKDEKQEKSEMGLYELSEIKEQVLLHESHSAQSDKAIGAVECTQETEEEELNQSIERIENPAKSEEGLTEAVGKQSQSKLRGTRVIEQHTEAEAPAQESQLESETCFSSSPTELNALVDSQHPLMLLSSKCVPSAEKELLQTQMEIQISSSDTCEQKPVCGDSKQNHPKRLRRGRPPKAKPPADNQGDSSLPLHGVIANALKLNVKKMKKQWPSRPQGRGIGRGRLCKQHRILKNKAKLACVNVDNDQLQHGNQGNHKQNLSENPISGEPEQNLSKRPRGRPPKSKTVANYQGEPIFSSDDVIPIELKPNEMENQLQYGQGRDRGRGGRGRGTGRGRGRPPICRDEDYYEKQLQNEDQAMQHGRGRGGRGSRGGRGRGRGRPRKLDRSANPSEEQSQPQDQAEGLEQRSSHSHSKARRRQQQHGQGCDQNQDEGQERPPNPPLDDQSATPSEEQSQPQDHAEGLEQRPSQLQSQVKQPATAWC